MRIKILFITTWYPESTNPMHGIFVQEQAKAVQLFDDVKIIHIVECQHKIKPSWQFVVDNDLCLTQGISTYRLYISRPRFRSSIFLFFILRTFQAFCNLYATGYRPNILHAHTFRAGFVAVLLGKLYKLPVIISEHNSAFPRNLITKSKLLLARIAMTSANQVLIVSKYLQKSIESYGIHGRFYVCPNVVDTSIFYPERKSLGPNTVKQLLFVGRLDPIKGLDDLFLALSYSLSKRSDWQLIIFGDGPNRTQYEVVAKQMGLEERIIFRGYQPKSVIAISMRQSDIFILPSHIETFSVVAAEALACGLPVLSTRCGGPEEFITPDVGKLVPVNDPKSLGAELLSMLDHLDQYKQNHIVEYATSLFSLSTIGTKIHNIYTMLSD